MAKLIKRPRRLKERLVSQSEYLCFCVKFNSMEDNRRYSGTAVQTVIQVRESVDTSPHDHSLRK